MIFLTVGTQLAFPRLARAMNDYAAKHDEQVIAPVGGDDAELPKLDVRHMLPPDEFVDIFRRARVVVAHAGIGTILSARRYNRPLVIVPRRHALGEHRNDHQLATAQALVGLSGLHVAWEIEDLPKLLDGGALKSADGNKGSRHAALVEGIGQFIAAGGKGAVPARTPGIVSQKVVSRAP